MNSQQIQRALMRHRHTRRHFLGVFPSDGLPPILQYPASLVVNLDPHDLPGSHWAAIYIDGNKKATYFDSFGLPPIPTIKLLLRTYSRKNTCSKRVLQELTSNVCGHYCILFILCRSRGRSTTSFLRAFGRNPKKNDALVLARFKKLGSQTV